MLTAKAGLPEMRDREDLLTQVANDLYTDGLMAGQMLGMVSGSSLMDRLTTYLGRELVRLTSAPEA